LVQIPDLGHGQKVVPAPSILRRGQVVATIKAKVIPKLIQTWRVDRRQECGNGKRLIFAEAKPKKSTASTSFFFKELKPNRTALL